MKVIYTTIKLINSVWFGIALIVIYLSVTFVSSDNFEVSNHKIVLLGAEYATIAQSLIAGNGYSNPFEFETGPTAWMPPVLVFIHVLVFKLLGMTYKAYLALTFLRFLGYTLSYYFLVKTKNLSKIKVANVILALTFIFYLRNGGFEILLLSMEHWVFHLLGALMLYSLYQFYKKGKGIRLLALLCFLVPMAAPALFIPQVIVVGIIFIIYVKQKWWGGYHLPQKINLRHFIVFGLMAVFSISLWTYRNYKTFNQLIVSKPNTWFEFYLSNIKDDKGVLHKSTFIKYHPLFNKDICDEIKEMGESNWLKQFDDSAKIYVSENREKYYAKVRYRMLNIFFFQQKMDDRQKVQDLRILESTDIVKLYNEGMVSGNLVNKQVNWDILQLKNDSVHSILNNCGLKYPELCFRDFLMAKSRFAHFSFVEKINRFAAAGFPIIALLLINFVYWRKDYKLLIILNLLYVVFFVPFVLVSFTNRYQLFVLEYQSLIVAIFLTFMIDLFLKPLNQKLRLKIDFI